MSDANWSTRIECVAVTCDGCSCCSRKTSSLDIISLRKSQNRFWKFESRPQSGHYITLHHIIITLSGITASLWALDPTRASDFRWHHPCDVQRIPTVMGWDKTATATWYGPTMPGISQLPNVQNKVCAEAPANYGSVMQFPHGYSDQ